MSDQEIERWLELAQRQMTQGQAEAAVETLRRVLSLEWLPGFRAERGAQNHDYRYKTGSLHGLVSSPAYSCSANALRVDRTAAEAPRTHFSRPAREAKACDHSASFFHCCETRSRCTNRVGNSSE